jgi:hypothetical protein
MSRNQATALLRDNAEDLRSYVVPTLATAGAKTREMVAPALATAGMKTRDMMVDEVLPRVKDGIAATEPWRAEAARRGTAAAQALAGHAVVEPKSRRWGRKAFLLTLLGAGAAAAWKAWKMPHDSDDWIYTDTPAPQATEPTMSEEKKSAQSKPAQAPLHAG